LKTIVKNINCVGLVLVIAMSLVMAALPAGGAKANGNQSPTDIILSNGSVEENKDGKTLVGNFTTSDPDIGDTFTYSLVSGDGDDDNTSFYINNNVDLRTVDTFDYETKSSYSIRVRSTDQGELWVEKAFTVTVIDVPENTPPIAVNDTYNTDENTPLNVSAPGVLVNDIDADDDPLTVTKVSDPSHGILSLNADGSFTYTPATSYIGPDTFTYKTDDDKAYSNVANVTITVYPVGECFVRVNIENMITQVRVLELPKGITNSMVQKLESSITSLERGQIVVAVNQLGAFVNEVNAQEGKKLSGGQVSGLMVNIFATAEATARSLKDSGSTASVVAQVLKNRFNLNALQASRILQNVGFSLSEVAQALKVVFSATATKIAGILKDVYGLGFEEVAQWLKDLDYSPSGIAQALKDVFSATKEGVAIWFKETGLSDFSLSEIAQAIKDVFSMAATEMAEILNDVYGLGFEEVAQRLKDFDYSPLGIAQALKDVFSATKEGVARWFKETGLSDFSFSEIAQAIKDVFSTTATEMTEILHEILELAPGEVVERLKELDYSPSGIAQALKDVLSATKEGVALWFKNAGFTALQTVQAIKGVFNTTASEIADILKNTFGSGAQSSAQILKDVGFAFWDIVSALINAFQMAWETAVTIVTTIFG